MVHSTVCYHARLYYTVLQYTIHYTVLEYIILYDAILHCTVLNYVLIYYTRKSHVKFCIDVSYILSYYVLLPFINVSSLVLLSSLYSLLVSSFIMLRELRRTITLHLVLHMGLSRHPRAWIPVLNESSIEWQCQSHSAVFLPGLITSGSELP